MKSKLLSLLLTVVMYSSGTAQVVEYDTTYRPRTYPLIVEQFKSYPDAPNDIIFLGNSLTAYTDWNELLDLPNARNRGISGDTSFGVLERLEEVIEGKPAKIFLLIGINDISRNFPVETIKANHAEIVRRIKAASPTTRIYIETLLPVNNTFARYKNHYNKDEKIFAVNQGIKALAEKEDLILVDLHPHFLDSDGRLDKRYTEEGLHLNAEGYQLWAKLLRPYLD